MGVRRDRTAVSIPRARSDEGRARDRRLPADKRPFRQAPVIDDDGFVVAESAAVVLYVAEKAGKLVPSDVQGRTRVMQWCFAATSTVEPTLQCMDVLEIFGGADQNLRTQVDELR